MSGKLMNILLRFSPETSPKIPTFGTQIKTLKQRTQGTLALSVVHTRAFPHSLLSLGGSLSLECPVPFPPSFLQVGFLAFLSPKPQVPLFFASVTCFLSPHSPVGLLLLLLKNIN